MWIFSLTKANEAFCPLSDISEQALPELRYGEMFLRVQSWSHLHQNYPGDRIYHILHCVPAVPFNYFYTECGGTLMHYLVHICILPAGYLQDSDYDTCAFVPPMPTTGVWALHKHGWVNI